MVKAQHIPKNLYGEMVKTIKKNTKKHVEYQLATMPINNVYTLPVAEKPITP